jgi:H+-transporting ATPase
MLPCEGTQIAGTIAVVYGWFMAPTGWSLALLVWAYALLFFAFGSAVKIAVYHLLARWSAHQARYLSRIEHRLAQ